MKKTFLYYTLMMTTATVCLSSCGNDWLDLSPSDSVPSDKAIVDADGAKAAWTGMYDGLQGNSSYTGYYGARMFYYGDVRGDDMQAEKQGNRSSSCYEMQYTLDNAPNMWNVPYNVIQRANRLIDAIDKKQIKDAAEGVLESYRAQALVVRAMVHFDLVRVYGNTYTMDQGASAGVPIVNHLLEATALPGRDKVADVYAQVVKDLTEAIDSKALETKKQQGYLNLWAAKALLTRVYLYMGDNAKALSTAEDIIKNSPYALWTDEQYVNAWSKKDGAHTNEMLFEIINYSSEDWTDREGIAYLLAEDGYADLIATKSFLDIMKRTPKDVRKGILIKSVKKAFIDKYGEETVFVNKFPADDSGEMRMNNIPLLRLSEVYLNAAEAAVKLGNENAKAMEYLSAIAQRDGTETDLKGTTIKLEQVLLERRKELIGEGQRFFDAMRNNETVVRYTDNNDRGFHYILKEESQSFNRTYFRALLPIPVSETNANPVLREQQNPGY
ncbi:MAG: RagB/SusD family nutrient uptake outer membrane protein [Mediterranea sp.]|jgi:tetratricopeptide (TPR) repeat protein|nr:RagB/SusD family nutrient uptake outer membrane protein [Mediterranea sp.]